MWQTLLQSASSITKWGVTPHSWIKKSKKMFGVATSLRQLTGKSMNMWNTELTVGNQNLGNVKIKQKIFQGVFSFVYISGDSTNTTVKKDVDILPTQEKRRYN